MRTMCTDDLFRMEVINLCDGARLGCPDALEFDVGSASLIALSVPCEKGLSGYLPLGRRESWRIPWCKIECIGEDTILVRMTPSETAECCREAGKRKNRR